ncbi:tRNA methyltransferase, has a role in tRNA modification [Ascosphaera pollenicola]|nr:tRNA methyltransferase, has a role in tRNA modification [Ascosphaera pollenicola]
MSSNRSYHPVSSGTVARVEVEGAQEGRPEPTAVLHLRGVATPTSETASAHTDESSRASVQWADDVVDNEGMGKKKSKVCCIYEKPRAVDESSSESDSSSSGSDSDSGDEQGGENKPSRSHRHDHDENDPCNHNHGDKRAKPRRKAPPNAYERQPKPKHHAQKK